LIILDLTMPELDGYGVLEAIRADSACRHIPVVVLSANCDSVRRARALKSGADRFISKSGNLKVLYDTIAGVFTERRMAG